VVVTPVSGRGLDWRRAKRFGWFAGAVVAIVLSVGAVYLSLAVPILVSAFLSYLCSPFVDALERRGVSRSISTLGIIGLVAIAIVFGLVAVIPFLYAQFTDLLQRGPEAFRNWYSTLLPQVTEILTRFGLSEEQVINQSVNKFNFVAKIFERFESGIGGIWDTTSRLVGGVVNAMLVPFLMFFMLRDEHRLVTALTRLVPLDMRQPGRHVVATVNTTLRSVIKGTVMVAVIDGLIYTIGLSALGVQSALAIGLVGGLCRFIPYLDAVAVLLLGLISVMANFDGWGQVIGLGVLVLSVQAIDGVFITPRVIGENVGLHPAVVVLTVFAFAKIFGFWGILIAIPVAAIIKAIGASGLPFWFASGAYTGAVPETDRELGAYTIDLGSEPGAVRQRRLARFLSRRGS